MAKGALERFVIRALRRAVEDPMPGAGLPKLKLCARCVATNLKEMNRRKNTTVPRSAYTTTSISVEPTPKPDPDLFAELLKNRMRRSRNSWEREDLPADPTGGPARIMRWWGARKAFVTRHTSHVAGQVADEYQ